MDGQSKIENRKSTMRVAYIAGPYRATFEFDVHRNIQLAEQAAAFAWQKGYAVICPHKNTAYMGGVVSDEAILEGDLVMMRRCDAVILCGKWYASRGACAEVAEAMRLGLPIYEYKSWPVEALMCLQPGDVTQRMARDTRLAGAAQVSDAACDDGDGAAFGGAAGAAKGVDVLA
jgi:nucleoside 2-deoxyribosyltransferase